MIISPSSVLILKIETNKRFNTHTPPLAQLINQLRLIVDLYLLKHILYVTFHCIHRHKLLTSNTLKLLPKWKNKRLNYGIFIQVDHFGPKYCN